MRQITQVGAFTSESAAIVNGNFAALAGVDWFVDPQHGSDTAGDGFTPSSAFASMSALDRRLAPGDVVGLIGVLRQQWSTPLGVNDVEIRGLASPTPRQATNSGAPNGGGSTWLSPTSVDNALPLIRVRGQGWTLNGIYFNNSATAAPCVEPYTDGDPSSSSSDGAHLLVVNCILTGAAFGVRANGGTNFVKIINCTLFGFSGSGDIAIAQTVGAGVGTLLGWRIENCRFYGNASNIVMPFNMGTIKGCLINNGSAANINLAGGTAPNFVQQNAFNITAADFDPAGGTTGVSGDVWSNYLIDAIETSLPAN